MSSDAARTLGRLRWAKLDAEQRAELARRGGVKGGKAAWAGMSAEQRSAENRRRAAKRRKA